MTGQPYITTADLRGPSTDVTVARQLLHETLNDIVAQTRADMSQAWQQWNEAGWAERNLWLEPANAAQGFAGGIWGWLESTWELVEGLGQLLTQPFDSVDEMLAEMGDLASDAKELFILVYHDEPTREMLLQFADDWWAAIPPDERNQLAAQFGTQFLADFVVGAVLAAFTAGAGALAIVAKWANRIHKAGGRIGDILDKLDDAILRLGKALKKRDRGHAEELNANDDGELESVWAPTKSSGKYARRKDVSHRSADDVNSYFPTEWEPPYKRGTRVTEFATTDDDVYVRVHGKSNKARSWMMKREAIDGLTSGEIQSKYALPDVPEFMSEVYVPAGTRIRTGKVNPVFDGVGNATQYELLQRLPESAFKNTARLEP